MKGNCLRPDTNVELQLPLVDTTLKIIIVKMYFVQCAVLVKLWMLTIFVLKVFGDDKPDKKPALNLDQIELLKKLKQKELITRVTHKPEDCEVLSENGDELHIHYTGYLQNGGIFDSSEKAGKKPIKFLLGSGQVIKGWDEGLLGMCEGEKRRLLIPPHLGYGKSGFPPVIPSDATLMFETWLVKLRKKGASNILENLEEYTSFLKYLIAPAVIAYVFYFLYHRYQAEAQTKKEEKQRRKKR